MSATETLLETLRDSYTVKPGGQVCLLARLGYAAMLCDNSALPDCVPINLLRDKLHQ